MSWKKWKRGLLVAIVTGLAGGAIGIVIGLNWEQLGILFAVNVGKDVLLYVKNHPTEIIHDTAFLKKP